MAKAKNTIKAITRKTPGWITALQPLVLPAVPAVYVAFSGKRVTYIGSAVNLRSRFYLHGARTASLAPRANTGSIARNSSSSIANRDATESG
jgi:phage gp37-like protein